MYSHHECQQRRTASTAAIVERATAQAHAAHEADTVAADITTRQQTLTELTRHLAENVISVAAYTAARATIEQEVDDLRARHAHLVEQARRLDPLGDIHDDLVAMTTDMDLGTWRRTLSRIINRIEVHPGSLIVVPAVGEAAVLER